MAGNRRAARPLFLQLRFFCSSALLISAAAPRSVEADEGAHCLLLGPAGAYLDETQIPLSLCSGPPALLPCRAQAAVFRCEQIGGSSKPPLSPTSCNCRGVIGRTPATPSPSSPTRFLLVSFSSLSRIPCTFYPLVFLNSRHLCITSNNLIRHNPQFLSATPALHQQTNNNTPEVLGPFKYASECTLDCASIPEPHECWVLMVLGLMMTVILRTTWWVLANTAVHWVEGGDIKKMCYNAMLKCGILYTVERLLQQRDIGCSEVDTAGKSQVEKCGRRYRRCVSSMYSV